ncbi:hypothetical protein [Agrobacterium sp. CG674]
MAADVQPAITFAKGVREFVFTTIESLVVLAALEIALARQGALWLWAIYGVAWLALLTYLVMYARYAINFLAEILGLSHKNREMFLWIAGTLSLCSSYAFMSFIPAVTAAFIKTNFMQ